MTGASRASTLACRVETVLLAAEAARTAESPGEVGEVVVTAQKRSERLQDVPLSVTALSAAQLAETAVWRNSDLQSVNPGLNRNCNGVVRQPTIRSVGARGATAGGESNVPPCLDGVYIGANNIGLPDLANMQRVEALKGPQGMLSGRDATGEAISIVTRDPTQEPEGSGWLSCDQALAILDGGVTLSVWGRNLSDDTYMINLSEGAVNDYATHGQPRPFGFKLERVL